MGVGEEEGGACSLVGFYSAFSVDSTREILRLFSSSPFSVVLPVYSVAALHHFDDIILKTRLGSVQ